MSNHTEQWRAIPGWEGMYEVSSLGRVRSIRRMVPMLHRNGTPMLVPRGGGIRRLMTAPGGYKKVLLYRDAKHHVVAVHHAVLEAFVEPRPPGAHTRHLNGDPSDNRPENLAWGTPSENAEDRRRHGTLLVGVKQPRARLDPEKVRIIRSSTLTDRELGERLGVSESTVRLARKGITWRHVE